MRSSQVSQLPNQEQSMQAQRRSLSALWRQSREARAAYLFVLPVFILFVVFRFGPAIASLVLSFADYEIGGNITFISFDNYRQLINDSVFWTSVRVTVVYTAMVMPLTTISALVLALLLTK